MPLPRLQASVPQDLYMVADAFGDIQRPSGVAVRSMRVPVRRAPA